MSIIELVINGIVTTIASTGYIGVGILMLLESCGIPAPSEVIMPFAGFLVAKGNFDFWLVVIIGTIGNLLGSLLAYWIGYKGGRPLIEKYGKYIFISSHDLDRADHWFATRGEALVFFGRLLPVVRTYISFPAGIAQMDLKKFSLYTFLGALPWCLLFTWFGMLLQNNWGVIHAKLHYFDYLIAVCLLFFIGKYIRQHIQKNKLT